MRVPSLNILTVSFLFLFPVCVVFLFSGCDKNSEESLPPDPSPMFTPHLGPGLMPNGFDWIQWRLFSMDDLKQRYPKGEIEDIAAFVNKFPEDPKDGLSSFMIVTDIQNRLERMNFSYSYHPDRVPSPNLCEQMDARYRKAAPEVSQAVREKMGQQESGPAFTEWLWCAGVADGQVPIRIRCLESTSSATLQYEKETASVEPCAAAFGAKDPLPDL